MECISALHALTFNKLSTAVQQNGNGLGLQISILDLQLHCQWLLII